VISPIELQDLANEQKFNTANLEKVVRLIDLLAEVYAHPFLQDRLVLKGGTAINIFLFDVPRLSVDIDFNYIGSRDKEAMIEERTTIREVFKRIFKIAKYESEFSENYGSDRYNLWYKNASGNRDRIKVETNFLLRVPLLKPVKSRKQRLFQLLPLPTVKILAPEELFATKIVALLARHTARDLYDVDRLYRVSRTDLEQPILRTCIFYGVVNREDFREMSEDAVALITEREIKRTLRPLLRRDSTFDFDGSQERVRKFLAPLLKLYMKQRQFVDEFFSGKYSPELLFDSESFSHELSDHPMVQWKIGHILHHRESLN
jgi:predicted nucleotidyltransferase component of viral defense system